MRCTLMACVFTAHRWCLRLSCRGTAVQRWQPIHTCHVSAAAVRCTVAGAACKAGRSALHGKRLTAACSCCLLAAACCGRVWVAGTGDVPAVSTHWGIHDDVYCAVSRRPAAAHGGRRDAAAAAAAARPQPFARMRTTCTCTHTSLSLFLSHFHSLSHSHSHSLSLTTPGQRGRVHIP